MAPQIDNKLRSLIHPLRALGFVLKGIPRGIRIKFEKGPDVDIYTLKSNPTHIRARIKTQIADEEIRERMVETIERQIADSLDSVADLHDFRLTKDSDGLFVYYAHLDIFGETPAPEPQQSNPSAEEDREALEATEAMLEKAFLEDEAGDEAGSDGAGPDEAGPDEAGTEEGETEAPGLEEFSADEPPGDGDGAGEETPAPQAADDISPDDIFIDDASVEAFLGEDALGEEGEQEVFEKSGEQAEEAVTGEAADQEASPDEAGEPEIDFAAYIEEMEAGAEQADPPSPRVVVEQLEAVDAKMLRQAMDSLSLPRSSNVRLVLTRLYRSALDPEELSDSVREEAAKITTDEDREMLKMLRETHAVDFLNPLIDLLYRAVQEE